MTDWSQRKALWLLRERVYWEGFDRRRDALFELRDALGTAGPVPAFVPLSLAALFRRGWGSAYDALAAGRLEEPALRGIVASCPLEDGAPIYALDTRLWTRNDAETRLERGYDDSPSRHSARQPSQAGWAYAGLA